VSDVGENEIAVEDQVRGAKLDRLSRDAHFLFGVEKAGGGVRDGGMPSANRHTVWIMAMVADEERRMISKRTEEALAVAKAEGKRLGGNRGNLPVIGDKGRIASLESSCRPGACHRGTAGCRRCLPPADCGWAERQGHHGCPRWLMEPGAGAAGTGARNDH
jgi:hypothetical protein